MAGPSAFRTSATTPSVGTPRLGGAPPAAGSAPSRPTAAPHTTTKPTGTKSGRGGRFRNSNNPGSSAPERNIQTGAREEHNVFLSKRVSYVPLERAPRKTKIPMDFGSKRQVGGRQNVKSDEKGIWRSTFRPCFSPCARNRISLVSRLAFPRRFYIYFRLIPRRFHI